MLSLAAYNSSDDSDSENENGEQDNVNQKSSEKSEAPEGIKSSVEGGRLFASLPPPKMSSIIKNDVTIEEDETLSFRDKKSWNVKSKPDVTARSTRQPVKITVPSLSEFHDDEPAKKKTRVSSSGSGLIGILPSPQNARLKEKKLIPAAVLLKPLPKRIPESVRKYFKSAVSEKEEEKNEEETVSVDFFSLADPKEVETISASNISDQFPTSEELGNEATDPVSSYDIQDDSLPESKPHDLDSAGMSNDAIVYAPETPPVEIPGNFYSDEGFMRLQGKRNRKLEDVSIIDVHADQHLPDSTLYLKSLSEEQSYQSHNNMPSAQHRRKHQITYLAYQAKERELELKNQWANNRMTRYQTQAKYGF